MSEANYNFSGSSLSEMKRKLLERIHVHPAPSRFPVSCFDLRGIPNAERDAEVLRIGLEQAALPFNLKDGPLLRASALTMSNSESWLDFRTLLKIAASHPENAHLAASSQLIRRNIS